MAILSEIEPQQKLRMMDLVENAGVDVSDWSNSKRGKKGAAMNPKYCYEWAFVEAGKVVVLNIWHHFMEERNGGVVLRDMNMREFGMKRKGVERRRAFDMDDAIQTALKDKLVVRVIVLGGKRRDISDPLAKPSKVTKRMLDPVPWAVSGYEWKTGACTLTRGATAADVQNDIKGIPDVDEDAFFAIEGRKRWAQHFRRERRGWIVAEKKRQVLARRGKLVCEACDFNFTEFYHPHAANFCEVHHRTPLSQLVEGTKTKLKDLAILCSNCHRVIHLMKIMPRVEDFRALLKERR